MFYGRESAMKLIPERVVKTALDFGLKKIFAFEEGSEPQFKSLSILEPGKEGRGLLHVTRKQIGRIIESSANLPSMFTTYERAIVKTIQEQHLETQMIALIDDILPYLKSPEEQPPVDQLKLLQKEDVGYLQAWVERKKKVEEDRKVELLSQYSIVLEHLANTLRSQIS